jgi:hypothetical protein
MSSETARLRANAEDQIARLLTQLADLEEAKEVRARVRRESHPSRRVSALKDAL